MSQKRKNSEVKSGNTQKAKISFDSEVLGSLDRYAETKFKGNGSAAANHPIGALFQK